MRRHAKAVVAVSALLLTLALAPVASADTAPGVAIDPASQVSYTSAHLSGEVNPNGGPSTTFWQLQYSTGSEGPWELAASGQFEGTEAEETNPIKVKTEPNLSNLKPNTTYFIRIVAVNEDGANQSIKAGPSFTTLEVQTPSVSIDPVSTFTATTAQLTGDVNPNAPEASPTSLEVEAGFRVKWHFQCTPSCPSAEGVKELEADEASEEVSAGATGLKPGTDYSVRLFAENAGAEANAGPEAFTTEPVAPVIGSASVSGVGATTATLKSSVNPSGAATAYRFEYVTEAEFQANGFASPQKAPVPDAAIGSDPVAVPVSEELSGLQADTAYRYRVIATNAIDTSTGAVKGFKTAAEPTPEQSGNLPGQGFLPDNRAWEMVSPSDKNGGGVSPNSEATRVSDEGEAAQFSSLQGFADSRGSGVTFEYMAKRSTDPDPGDNGWDTHAITPPQDTQTAVGVAANLVPSYKGAFTPDFSRGIFFAWSPLTADPMVANMANFYRRDDLLEPGPGSYELVSPCPLCAEQSPPEPLPSFFKIATSKVFAGASADFSHVFFESQLSLVQGAAFFQPNAYEYAGGELRLVGVLPSGQAPPRSVLGSAALFGGGSKFAPRPISDDGSRVVFMVPDSENALSGALYMRINGRSTTQLNASERTTPAAPESARFWHISRDGTRAVLTSPEPLTDDAPEGSFSKLYMWERQDHDETQEVKVDASGGEFTLSFNGASTSIPFDASAATVEDALEALKGPAPLEAPLIGEGNVEVSGGPGSAGGVTPYEITFKGDFAGANVAELQADGSTLTGGASSAIVATTQPVENLRLLGTGLSNAGTSPTGDGVFGASDDGSYVYFTSEDQLDPAGPPLPFPESGIFLWHEEEITYIGNGTAIEANNTFYGNTPVAQPRQARVSPDGRGLLFVVNSGAGLLSAHGGTDYDHAGRSEHYLYRADNDHLACVSCKPSGEPATASSAITARDLAGAAMSDIYENRALSDDGRYVFFSTAQKLVQRDSNGVTDAYVYDSETGEARLLSSGESNQPSYFMNSSADGHDAFFVTAEPLSGWDVDGAYDLYDARVGGGFPEPPPAPPSCQGDGCQPAPLNLNDPTPASSSFSGSGDPKAKRNVKARCPKGKRRVQTRSGKSRCVNKKNKKRANANRRAGK